MQENKTYNILIVSNEKKIINKISILFESSKYKFELARDMLSAINKIKFNNYDIILINFSFSKILLELFVNKIRFFDSFSYIILYSDDTLKNDSLNIIKNYDIQAYYNTKNNLNKLICLIELISNAIYEFTRINLRLDNFNIASKSPYLSTVQILRDIAEYKDKYTIGHSFRVSKYSTLIGRALGLSNSDLKTLKVGSMFHDIGKISIPNSILLKNTSLTDSEYYKIKFHPLIGSHFVSPAIIYSRIIPIIKFHHEKFDGTGYPCNLKGSEIPLLVRIVSIADSFDAMASKRSYRDSLPIDLIIRELEKNKGYQFDPEITDVFLEILKNDFYKIKKIQKRYK